MSWLSKLIFGDDSALPSAGAMSTATTGAGSTAASAAQAYSQAQGAFDPQSAINTYAKGAYSAFDQELEKQLKTFQGQEAGAGRFNSGYYDEDQGQLVKDLASTEYADLTRTAVQGAGMKQAQIGQELGYAEDTSGQYYDLLSGQLDREQADANAKRQQRSQLWGDLFKLAGTGVSAATGGIG